MFKTTSTIIALLTASILVCCGLPAVAAEADVDKAFDALKTYDWGQDRNLLKPIDDAIVGSHGDAAAQKDLASRLAEVLKTDAPQAAKDFVCRKLSLIGSAASVPALAGLLPDEKLSHMARYALERMPAAEAVKAMRDAMPKVKGRVKVGVINSLGVRRDAESTASLVALLADADKEVVSAAAAALGEIGSPEAAKALGDFQKKAPEALRPAAADAYLACAERLLADGKKAEATAIYKALSAGEQPKHVRMAAMRGMLSATGKK